MAKLQGMLKNKKIIGYIVIIAIVVVLHIIINPIFRDDEQVFRLILRKNNGDIIKSSNIAYNMWSSRYILHFLTFLFCKLPAVCWKIIDSLVVIFLYKYFTDYNNRFIETALLFAIFPFQIMLSAGWIATTVNYLWPLLFSVISFLIMYQKKRRCWDYVLFFVFVSISTNFEIILGLFLVSTIILIITDKKSNRERLWFYFLELLIVIAQLVNLVVSPGFHNRATGTNWLPEYEKITMWNKLRIGIVSTVQHFTSLPNVLFVLFSLVLFIALWQKSKVTKERMIGIMPLIVSLSISLYYGMANIIINRHLTYVNTKIFIKPFEKEFIAHYLLLIAGLTYVVAVICSLLIIYKNRSKRVLMTSVFVEGIIARMVIIFSPTILASGTRMYFFMYMAMIFIAGDLFNQVRMRKKIKLLVGVIFILGICINIFMIIKSQHTLSTQHIKYFDY